MRRGLRIRWVAPAVLLLCALSWLVVGDGAYRLTHNGEGPGIAHHLVKRPAHRLKALFERDADATIPARPDRRLGG